MSRSGRTGRYEGPSADVYEYGALGKHLCFFFKKHLLAPFKKNEKEIEKT